MITVSKFRIQKGHAKKTDHSRTPLKHNSTTMQSVSGRRILYPMSFPKPALFLCFQLRQGAMHGHHLSFTIDQPSLTERWHDSSSVSPLSKSHTHAHWHVSPARGHRDFHQAPKGQKGIIMYFVIPSRFRVAVHNMTLVLK